VDGEGAAQVVEAHDAHAGVPARVLEALGDLRAAQRRAEGPGGRRRVVVGGVEQAA